MNQISIAIFVWGLRGDAIANNASAMAQGFKDLGIERIYLIYLFEQPGKNVAIPQGVNLISLGVKRSIFAPLALAKVLKKEQPDFLISMPTIINIPAIIGWKLAGNPSTKLIVSEHSTMSYKSHVEYNQDLRMRIMPWLARRFYPLANGVRANCEAVLDDLLTKIRIRVKPQQAITITNPVNVEAIANCSKAPVAHPWLQHKDKPVILSVARLAKQKNFPLLIEAFARVRQKIDARLIIAGEGPERSALESLISELNLEDAVSVPGFSDNPWSYMSQADVFALASEEEPFGLVIVEAMACGLPVIATDAMSGGPKTILDNGKYGTLVANHDPEALANAILEVLTNEDTKAHFVAAGHQRCQAYRPEVVARQWLAFLENL